MSDKELVLITGASGFVGSALLDRLINDDGNYSPVAAFRQIADSNRVNNRMRSVIIGNHDAYTNWSAALVGVACVVHAAARVHVMNESSLDPMASFREVNVNGTLCLARQAAASGVRRFVFISSVKVNGEETAIGRPFVEADLPQPSDPYGQSKYEAELGLRELAANTGMEIVIIRPPLVYGYGVKANFAAMMRWLKRGVPLPLGGIHNQRSLVSLSNLVDLIVTCLTHSAAANQTFMVSDGEDVSTSDLLRRMGKVMGHPARLISFPEYLLKVAAGLLGQADVAQRLCGSLQVDISKARELLGWTPPLTLDEGLAQAVLGFK